MLLANQNAIYHSVSNDAAVTLRIVAKRWIQNLTDLSCSQFGKIQL